jgi:hypothetical protein
MAELNLSAFDREMQSALTRLDGLVTREQTRTSAPAVSPVAGVSFGALDVAPAPETGPEADLLSLMDEAQWVESGVIPEAGGTVAFGFEDSTGGRWTQAKADFDAFVEKINRDVFHFAVVESAPFIRTQVEWGGDALTVVAEDASTREIGQHAELLRRELMLRNLRLRMFATVATAAGKITVLIATPGAAPLLALPMAYQFVSQLSSQWQEYQSFRS